MTVRPATADDLSPVLTIFDSAMLETDLETVRTALDRDDLLVAVADERVLGACLLLDAEIDAIAVRPNRRGQGLGRELVAAALDTQDRLVAEFDPRVRPFWDALGFEIEPISDERFRGVRE